MRWEAVKLSRSTLRLCHFDYINTSFGQICNLQDTHKIKPKSKILHQQRIKGIIIKKKIQYKTKQKSREK